MSAVLVTNNIRTNQVIMEINTTPFPNLRSPRLVFRMSVPGIYCWGWRLSRACTGVLINTGSESSPHEARPALILDSPHIAGKLTQTCTLSNHLGLILITACTARNSPRRVWFLSGQSWPSRPGIHYTVAVQSLRLSNHRHAPTWFRLGGVDIGNCWCKDEGNISRVCRVESRLCDGTAMTTPHSPVFFFVLGCYIAWGLVHLHGGCWMHKHPRA